MKKKADVSAMKIIIIAIIVLILLFGVATKVFDIFSVEGERRVCQASILKAHLLDETTAGVAEKAASMLDLRINSLECNNLPDTVIKKSNTVSKGKINDNAVKKQIADAMFECWKMTGSGEIDPYKVYDNDQAYCLLCGDLIFDDKFVEQMNEENYKVKGIIHWMAVNPIPGTKNTYFKALYGIEPDKEILRGYEDIEIPIDAEQQYAIIWRLDTVDQSVTGILLRLSTSIVAGSVLGAKAGGAIGASIGTFTIPVIGTAGLGAAGAVTGAFAGGAIGLIGSYAVSELTFGSKIISSGIFAVPKKQLGEEFSLGDFSKKPFCTKLVNY